jgi:6-pyruvoyltetrahydropterin/6-carboxytetrahydropterin synthase
MQIYKIKKISCAHQLKLPYESPCNREHGHNYTIEVWVDALRMNKLGMVADYSDIGRVIMAYDHRNLNDFMQQPTAENFALLLLDALEGKIAMPKPTHIANIKVRVWETETSYCEAQKAIA